VFGVLPSLARFHAGGANANIQWCGQNFAQLPNGFGFGGQVRYWCAQQAQQTFQACGHALTCS
jgi:hypothetical protein